MPSSPARDDGWRPTRWQTLRLLLAETALGWALSLAPPDHREGRVIIRGIDAILRANAAPPAVEGVGDG